MEGYPIDGNDLNQNTEFKGFPKKIGKGSVWLPNNSMAFDREIKLSGATLYTPVGISSIH